VKEQTVPHHKQFKKSIKQSKKAQLRNRAVKSQIATIIKKVTAAQSREEAEAAFKSAVSIIDTTARKGIIKKQTAARKKSRLSRIIARLQ
jgi:small subunit ribosomal protein S20